MSSDAASQLEAIASSIEMMSLLHISTIVTQIIHYLQLFPIYFVCDVLRSHGDPTYASLLFADEVNLSERLTGGSSE